MARVVVHRSVLAQWHHLVCEAQGVTRHRLPEEMESYLVFLLMRFTRHSALAEMRVATDLMSGAAMPGQEGRERLRAVGDHCLLFSGLFPRLARRRRVGVGYFVKMGRAAYHTLSQRLTQESGSLYRQLGSDFTMLMDILQATRSLQGEGEELLHIYEQWLETGSSHAYERLRRATGEQTVILPPEEGKHPLH